MNALEQRIIDYQRQGWILLNHTSYIAQLRKPKDNPGCIPLIILFMLSILLGIIYWIYSSRQEEKIATLVLNNQGAIEETYTGGGWGVWSFALLALIVNIVFIVAVIVVLVLMGLIAGGIFNNSVSSTTLSLL
jgi:hypothetical protein